LLFLLLLTFIGDRLPIIREPCPNVILRVFPLAIVVARPVFLIHTDFEVKVNRVTVGVFCISTLPHLSNFVFWTDGLIPFDGDFTEVSVQIVRIVRSDYYVV